MLLNDGILTKPLHRAKVKNKSTKLSTEFVDNSKTLVWGRNKPEFLEK